MLLYIKRRLFKNGFWSNYLALQSDQHNLQTSIPSNMFKLLSNVVWIPIQLFMAIFFNYGSVWKRVSVPLLHMSVKDCTLACLYWIATVLAAHGKWTNFLVLFTYGLKKWVYIYSQIWIYVFWHFMGNLLSFFLRLCVTSCSTTFVFKVFYFDHSCL
jgi:hypothetical protein